MFFKLIFNNIKRFAFRYTFIFLIAFIVSLSVSFTYTFISEMRAGISVVKNRLGADLVVLPKNAESVDVESVLFNGTPVTYNMPSLNLTDVPQIENYVKRLYLATLDGQSCCDGSIQLIATDIADDFLLSPYITTKTLADNEIILGHRFNVTPGTTVKYFGREFTVKERMEKTNTGLDLSGFISYTAAASIINDPNYSDIFSDFTDTSVSMIFIKSFNPKLTNNVIKSKYGDIASVYVPDKKIADYTKSLFVLQKSLNVINISLIIVGILSLLSITSISVETRRNEFGSVMLLGYKVKHCYLYFTVEHLIVTFTAWLVSILSLILIKPIIGQSISKTLDVPMVNTKDLTPLIMLGFMTLAVIISTFLSILKITKTDPATLIKEAT